MEILEKEERTNVNAGMCTVDDAFIMHVLFSDVKLISPTY